MILVNIFVINHIRLSEHRPKQAECGFQAWIHFSVAKPVIFISLLIKSTFEITHYNSKLHLNVHRMSSGTNLKTHHVLWLVQNVSFGWKEVKLENAGCLTASWVAEDFLIFSPRSPKVLLVPLLDVFFRASILLPALMSSDFLRGK